MSNLAETLHGTISANRNEPKVRIMERKEWLTPNQAAERDDCPVTGKTLIDMIKRGDVPDGCWMKVPYGRTRKTYYIDAECLAELDYNTQGRERGWNKEK